MINWQILSRLEIAKTQGKSKYHRYVSNPPPHESHSHFCLGVGLGTQVRARPLKPPHLSYRYRWEASSQAQLRSRHSLAQGAMAGPRKTRIFTTISHGSHTW